MSLRGAPYSFGGVSPDGFDCSGFTYFVFNRAGIPMSRDMTAQYHSGVHPSRDHLVPGDLVFFRDTYMPGLSHSGIYTGNGEFIHANNEDSGVTVSRLNSAYWDSRWYGAARPHGT
jgi:cell wall-associated NlpC family hydrolase